MFAGYWRKDEATRQTMTEDGWLRTGDVGEWVDGTHLKITDRMKDIIITAGGKNVSPSMIENALKASPFIKEAIVIGDGRKFLSALIGIELDTVGEWAQRRQLGYSTYRDLSEKPEVVELVAGIVKDVNSRFAPGRAGARVPAAAQGARPRGRRAHRHPEGEAVRDLGDVRGHGRRHVRRGGAVSRPVTELLEALLRGLGTGSIYAMLALAFVIVFKATGVINFAQPAMMLAGATITSYVAPAIGIVAFASLSFFVSVTVAALCTAALGMLIERTAIRPMVGRPGVRGRDHHDRHRHRRPGRGRRVHRARGPADPQPLGPRAGDHRRA